MHTPGETLGPFYHAPIDARYGHIAGKDMYTQCLKSLIKKKAIEEGEYPKVQRMYHRILRTPGTGGGKLRYS